MAAGEVTPTLTDFCRRERARIVGMLALYVGDVAIAEDPAQETFVGRVTRLTWPVARLGLLPRGPCVAAGRVPARASGPCRC